MIKIFRKLVYLKFISAFPGHSLPMNEVQFHSAARRSLSLLHGHRSMLLFALLFELR